MPGVIHTILVNMDLSYRVYAVSSASNSTKRIWSKCVSLGPEKERSKPNCHFRSIITEKLVSFQKRTINKKDVFFLFLFFIQWDQWRSQEIFNGVAMAEWAHEWQEIKMCNANVLCITLLLLMHIWIEFQKPSSHSLYFFCVFLHFIKHL